VSPLYREVKRLLVDHGCEFVRQGKGDHEIWWSPITDKRFPVDREGRNRHTFNGALKTAGIDQKV
jgi:hypothetical protein